MSGAHDPSHRAKAPAQIAGSPHGAEPPAQVDLDAPPPPPSDPRAVRATIGQTTRLEGDPTFTVTPAPDPDRRLPGVPPEVDARPGVDGEPVEARLERLDAARGRLTHDGNRTRVLFGPVRIDAPRGVSIREVVVDGWRFEVEIEPERRAALRERARRGAGTAGHGGPVEVRAIIPGRIVAVSVAPGDTVEAGQQILVVEAMKMQNELRAPREGTVDRVGVALGDTIEVGDLLVVIH